MTIAKGCLIKEIKDNQNIDGLFLIKELTRAETRTGNPYLMLTITDQTGEIGGRIWEDADRYAQTFRLGQVVQVNGLAQAYRGTLQLKVNSIKAVPEAEVDSSLFQPQAPGDANARVAELEQLIKSIKDKHLKKLVQAFFGDDEFLAVFRKAPAAKQMHHAYGGGLLEHTLAVARLADQVASLYPAVDRSLLLAGAILHDLGKIREFGFLSYPFDYTDQGRLMGHAVIAIEMLHDKIRTIKDFPEQRAVTLKHLILSHHGRHEFGAPVVPMMLEAFILHFIDDLDAKLNTITRLNAKANTPGYQWTDYQRTLERFLYVPGLAEQAEYSPGHDQQPDSTGKTKQNQVADDRQRLLFSSTGNPTESSRAE